MGAAARVQRWRSTQSVRADRPYLCDAQRPRRPARAGDAMPYSTYRICLQVARCVNFEVRAPSLNHPISRIPGSVGYYSSLRDLKSPPVKFIRFFASLRIEKLLTCMGAHRWGIYPRENSSRMANPFRFYPSGRPSSSSSDILFR